MYAATVGDVDGVRLIDDTTVKAATAERSNGPDACLVADSQFGCGFMLDGTLTPMLTPTSFGHAGAGGSLGYADPESKVGYGYVMNQMGGNLTGDPRTIGLTTPSAPASDHGDERTHRVDRCGPWPDVGPFAHRGDRRA